MSTPDLVYLFLYYFELGQICRNPMVFGGPWKLALDKYLTPIPTFFCDNPRLEPEEDA